MITNTDPDGPPGSTKGNVAASPPMGELAAATAGKMQAVPPYLANPAFEDPLNTFGTPGPV